MSDVISRQTAIDALKVLPPVQPEGDWVSVIRCKYCIVNPICRFKAFLGDDGYCSQGDSGTDEQPEADQ